MDTAVIMLAIIGIAPLVLLSVFRANAAVAFLALCLGSVLGTFVSDSLVEILRGFIAPPTEVTEALVRLILLWLPVVLVLFFMAGTISKRQRLLNAMPALGVGMVGLLLTVPFLTVKAQIAIGGTGVWQVLDTYQALIVAVSTIVSLLLLRMRATLHSDHGGHVGHH